jgi:hypothetical protein
MAVDPKDPGATVDSRYSRRNLKTEDAYQASRSFSHKSVADTITKEFPYYSEFGKKNSKKPRDSITRAYRLYLQQSEFKKPYLPPGYPEMEYNFDLPGRPRIGKADTPTPDPWRPDTILDPTLIVFDLNCNAEDEAASDCADGECGFCPNDTVFVQLSCSEPCYWVQTSLTDDPATHLENIKGYGTNTISFDLVCGEESGFVTIEASMTSFEGVTGTSNVNLPECESCAGDKLVVYFVYTNDLIGAGSWSPAHAVAINVETGAVLSQGQWSTVVSPYLSGIGATVVGTQNAMYSASGSPSCSGYGGGFCHPTSASRCTFICNPCFACGVEGEIVNSGGGYSTCGTTGLTHGYTYTREITTCRNDGADCNINLNRTYTVLEEYYFTDDAINVNGQKSLTRNFSWLNNVTKHYCLIEEYTITERKYDAVAYCHKPALSVCVPDTVQPITYNPRMTGGVTYYLDENIFGESQAIGSGSSSSYSSSTGPGAWYSELTLTNWLDAPGSRYIDRYCEFDDGTFASGAITTAYWRVRNGTWSDATLGCQTTGMTETGGHIIQCIAPRYSEIKNNANLNPFVSTSAALESVLESLIAAAAAAAGHTEAILIYTSINFYEVLTP